CAYVAEDHVLFHVAAMPDYGALAKRSLDEMIAGARVEVAPYKREPTDFVLWKPSKPGEPAWSSPAGIEAPGRPGWHIECSAMSWKHLGETFDIHGGGIDLVFPHHENEIAQSRCGFHTPFMARTWMHNGFLQVEGEKMAKSAGNFVTVNELLATQRFGDRSWSGQVLRLAMLMTHYRQPIDFSLAKLKYAEGKLAAWHDGVADVLASDRAELPPPSPVTIEALSDDLNVHAAIMHFDVLDSSKTADAKRQLVADLRFLGIDLAAFWQNVQQRQDTLVDETAVRKLIDARAAARKAKNFAESDRIRDELTAMGVVLKDSKDGTTWELAR